MDFVLPGRMGGASDVFIVGRVGAEKCGRGRTRSSGRRISQRHSAWNSYRSIGCLDLVLTSFIDDRLVLDLSCPRGEPVTEHQHLLPRSGRPFISLTLTSSAYPWHICPRARGYKSTCRPSCHPEHLSWYRDQLQPFVEPLARISSDARLPCSIRVSFESR
jgi:hypothetical protein